MSLLAVANLEATYAVPAGREGTEAQRVLDMVATTRLVPALAEELGANLPDDDESIWFVRRLDVQVTVPLDDLDEAAVAGTWARATADAIVRSLAAGGTDVIRFRDRSELLAELVLDLADRRAESRWYLASSEYSALASRPMGVAIRDALLSDPSASLRALVLVHEQRGLERVVRTLAESDASSLLDAWAGEEPRREDAFHAVLAAARDLRPLLTIEDEWRERDALLLVAAAAAFDGSARAQPHARAARETIELALRLRAGRPLAGGPDAREPQLALRDSALEAEAALLFAPREAVPALLPAADDELSPAGTVSPSVGAFLMLESLAELALPDGRARALALACALAGERADDALRDGVLCFAAGYEAPDGEPADAPSVDRGLVERLVDLERAELSHVVVELLAGEPALLVVRDAARDAWLAVRPAEPDLTTQVTSVLAEFGNPEAVLVRGLDVELALPVLRDGDELPPPFGVWLREARPAAGDLEALGFRSDPAAALVAHALLRGFAARLAGFQWSGAAYLRATFLEGLGTVAATAPAVVVDLPVSPLAIVLRMAGFDGRSVVVPWLDRPVLLRLPPS